MRSTTFYRFGLSVAAFVTAFSSGSAQARRTTIDGGFIEVQSGYCAPGVVGTADCAAQPLPFSLQIGGTQYDSFVVNGNGTLSLGGPVDFALATGTLSDYGIPVFSPLIDNEFLEIVDQLAGDSNVFDLDTKYVATFSTTPDSLTVLWFPCSTNIFCGPLSVPPDLDDGGGLTPEEVAERQTWGEFGLTLTHLGSGFALDYFYYANADSGRPYGFYLPGGSSLQTTGPEDGRSWIFDGSGDLVTSVPEPATWLMMVLGFGMAGLMLRRSKTAAALP